jgi:uncharacterized repeat protein (TIGR03943 family)
MRSSERPAATPMPARWPGRLSAGVRRWSGAVVATATALFSLWLAATGRLDLYVHPRYLWFSIVMAVIALALVGVAIALPGHGHGDAAPARLRRPPVLVALSTVVVVAALAVVTPTTLSSRQALGRDVASGGTALARTLTGQIDLGASIDDYTMVDWAATMQLRGDLAFYAGHEATFSGFVTPDETDPDDVLLITRFRITCCTLDAQPVGIPVHLPGWRDRFPVNSWVEGTGGFAVNPSTTSSAAIVFAPDDLHAIEEPDDPYLG